MQSAETISAAYDFDLAARDYTLADGAIELVIEGVPCSAFIKAAQSRKLIFGGRSDPLRGRRHAADGGKFCRDLQEHSRRAMSGESDSRHGFNFPASLFQTRSLRKDQWPAVLMRS
jgi:hypothetical protein